MVTMRSADADLTTRARIRNAAIHRFGQEGFDASLRTLAADAGVSPALVIHHFGSKEGLRAACDEHVRQIVAEHRLGAVRSGDAADLLGVMADIAEYAPMALYVVASLATGGPFARDFLDALIADAVAYIEVGVSQGLIRPSADAHARARYLTYSNVGALILHYELNRRPGEVLDVARLFSALNEIVTIPAVELLSEGFFTDDRYLRALRESSHAPAPPSATAPTPASSDETRTSAPQTKGQP